MDVDFSFSEDMKIGNCKRNSNWIKCSTKRAKIGREKVQFLCSLLRDFQNSFFVLFLILWCI